MHKWMVQFRVYLREQPVTESVTVTITAPDVASAYRAGIPRLLRRLELAGIDLGLNPGAVPEEPPLPPVLDAMLPLGPTPSARRINAVKAALADTISRIPPRKSPGSSGTGPESSPWLRLLG